MTIVVVPKFDFVNFLESIKKHRATHLLYDSTFPYALASRKLFCFFWVQGCPPYGHIVVQGLNLAPLPNGRSLLN